MGVLLRLGNPQLGHAHLAEVLAQAVRHQIPGEGHLDVGHGGVILGGTHVRQGENLPIEPVKLRVHKHAGDLPGAVGAEIEENDAVVVADGALAVADYGLHELVGHIVGIAAGHRVHGVAVLLALAVDHGVVRLLHPLPALIAVHGVVPAHDGGNPAHADLPAFFHRLGHKILAAGG